MSAAPPTLHPVAGRPSLGRYLSELADRREFIRTMPRHDLHAQNMHTVLGNLWFLVDPILSTAVYYVIFGLLLDVDRGVDNYIAYLVIGVLIFRYFSSATVTATRVMRRNETLMRSLYFPRASLPLSSAIGSFYTLLPGLGVMALVVILTGELPTWRWLLLPMVLATTFAFVTGAVLLVARLGSHFADLHSLLPHLTRLLFYVSGALYDPSRFDTAGLDIFFDVNPMYQLLTLARWCLMEQDANPWFWLTAPAWALGSLVVGFVVFWRGEATYGSGR